MAYDPRIVAYLYCFNTEADYYLCHEYGESLWLELGRPPVWKGLIQAAVSLCHLYRGNVHGAVRMWQRARAYMAPARPAFCGMDLERLTSDLDAQFAQVPRTWHRRQVDPSLVQALGLPAIHIRITDPELAEAVRHWQPLPDLPMHKDPHP
jgi:hypothetical protein